MSDSILDAAAKADGLSVEEVADSEAVLAVYAAPEWSKLSHEGREWVRAIVAETLRRHDLRSRAQSQEGDELEWQSSGRQDVAWEGLRRCPSCDAENVSLRRWLDARRWVRCRICKTTGPEKLSDADAAEAWNALPRSTLPAYEAQRSALKLERDAMREALIHAAFQFDFYADQHAAKGTAPGAAKAKTNRSWAQICRDAALPLPPQAEG